MHPEHDRFFRILVQGRCPDIQKLAVLRGRPEAVRRHDLAGRDRLVENRTIQPVICRIFDALPRFDRFRHFKPLCFRIPDPPEDEHPVIDEAADLSFRSLRYRIVGTTDKLFHRRISFFRLCCVSAGIIPRIHPAGQEGGKTAGGPCVPLAVFLISVRIFRYRARNSVLSAQADHRGHRVR